MTAHKDEHLIRIRPTASDDRSRVLKDGETFGVFNRFGDIQPTEMGDRGLYYDGTRFLSRYVFRVAGVRPLLLSSSITPDNSTLVVDLTNPELPPFADGVTPQDTLHFLREKLVHDQYSFERVAVTNYSTETARFRMSWDFGADFRDIFEVRGVERSRRGSLEPASVTDGAVELRYEGLDGVRRSMQIGFDPRPLELDEGHASFEIELAAGGSRNFEVRVRCSVDPPARAAVAFVNRYDEAAQFAIEKAAIADGDWARITTSNQRFNSWLTRSAADMRMMITETASGRYVYAGVPWFSAPFGRDGIIAALESLTLSPSLAAGVLRYLAATQATEIDSERDAEPGKILHEARGGEMAALGEIPFQRYYGSVDATPLFVMLAGAYYRRTADADLIDEIWPNLTAAVDWLDTAGDVDGDGFVEYSQQSRHGLVNQGWKDSHDSIMHADGRLATGRIALSEVQGYLYAARLAMAQLAAIRGDDKFERLQRRRAVRLRTRFDEAFWRDDLGTFALALDGDKQACAVRTSNAGHALFSGLAKRERAPQLARALLAGDMFSGWGVRTLSAEAPRFNPMSYHNGSVWPHDNALIASGLSRYGFTLEAVRLLTAQFDVAQSMELARMPELFCGFDRRHGQGPTQYPVACSPQSWAAGAVFMLLDACLGLTIDAPGQRIRFSRPALPPWLEEVTISELPIGNARADIRLHRDGDSVHAAVMRSKGHVDLVLDR
jgi:glycogen debranching enzyme